VCLVNENTYEQCRYLVQDENDYTKYYCIKKSPKAHDIDVEIDDFIKDAKKKGKDPLNENVPMGDNCAGYPILRFLEQGYDKP